MILRKPYAFLIKKFKFIHLVLALMILANSYGIYKIYDFLKYYISEGWTKGFYFEASSYINAPMYLLLFSILFVVLIVLHLMRKKEKPVLFYYENIISVVLTFIYFIYIQSTISSMEVKLLDTRVLSLSEDVTLIIFIINLIMLSLTLIRALGFDIKKFNFGEDLEEIKIEMADNEEVELNFEVDTDSALASIRKRKREFKYIYEENQFLINLTTILVIIITSGLIYLNIAILNKEYKINETFRAGATNVTVKNVYMTKENYKLKRVLDDKTYYVVEFEINNLIKNEIILEQERFKLIIGDKVYKPYKKSQLDLTDLGEVYDKQKLTGKNIFIFVYLVEDIDIKKDVTFRYTESLKFFLGGFEAKYKKANIKVRNLDIIIREKKEYKMPNEFVYENKEKVSIASYQISKNFSYQYNDCIKNVCNTLSDIITPSLNSKKDMVILKLVTKNRDIINKYVEIIYYKGDVSERLSISDRTPLNYKGDSIFLEVDSKIESATRIEVNFISRDKLYKYIIKE